MSSMQILLREAGVGIVLPTSAKQSGDSDTAGFADLLKRESSPIESSQSSERESSVTLLDRRVREEPRAKKDVAQDAEIAQSTIEIDPTLVASVSVASIDERVESAEVVNPFSSLEVPAPTLPLPLGVSYQINISSNDEQLATALSSSGAITDRLIVIESSDERDMSTNGEDSATRSDESEDQVVVAVPLPTAFKQESLDISSSSRDVDLIDVGVLNSQKRSVVVQQTQIPQFSVGETNLIQDPISMVEEVGAAIIRNNTQNIVLGLSSVSLNEEIRAVNLEGHYEAPIVKLSTPHNIVLSTEAELPTSDIDQMQANVRLQSTEMDVEYVQEIIGSSNVVKAFADDKVSKPIIVETAADATIVDHVLLPVPRVVELASDYQTAPKSLPVVEAAKGLDDFTEYTFEIVQDTIVEAGEVSVNRAEITFTKIEEEVTAKTLSDVGVDHKTHKATIDQVMIAVKHMRNANSKSVIINLHPAELGKIEIKLHVHDNAVQKIEMTAANRDTIALLQDSMAKLEAELKKVIGSEGASLHFNFKEGNHQESRGGERAQAQLSRSYNNSALSEVVSHYHISSRHHIGESGVSIRV